MANISITLECNRACTYCFANAARSLKITEQFMSRATFLQILNFLKRSHIHQVRLLGGEPTIHPDFAWFVEQVIAQGFSLFLFSNGLLTEIALAALEQYPPEKIKVLINVNAPDYQSSEENEQQINTFRRLRKRVIAGFNIHRANPNLDFLLDLIKTFDLSSAVRLGLAHPCRDGSNEYLLPGEYIKVGHRVYDFIKKAVKNNVHIEFDCGFVPCMFPQELFKLPIINLKSIGSCCGAVPDILPDGTAIHCYPLASISRVFLNENHVAEDIKQEINLHLLNYRTIGIFRECASCSLKSAGLCTGGCLSLTMQRLRTGSFTMNIPQNDSQPSRHPANDKLSVNINKKTGNREAIVDRDKTWVIPYIDQPIDFWKKLFDQLEKSIKTVYLPLPLEAIGSGRPLQPAVHVQDFLRQSPFSISVLVNPVILPEPLEILAPKITNALQEFYELYGVKEVTISNLLLAQYIKAKLPSLRLVASTLLDIATTTQVMVTNDIFDVIVPASRIMRNLKALQEIRKSYKGKIRMLVNESCLAGCPFRVQHFYEMANNKITYPASLCANLLKEMPWLRLTGAWVLPQHLYLYQGIYDELKLAGRVTLQKPEKYMHVLNAYIHKNPLYPNEIGGGPAAVLQPMNIDTNFYIKTMYCNHQCHKCTICREYYLAVN